MSLKGRKGWTSAATPFFLLQVSEKSGEASHRVLNPRRSAEEKAECFLGPPSNQLKRCGGGQSERRSRSVRCRSGLFMKLDSRDEDPHPI